MKTNLKKYCMEEVNWFQNKIVPRGTLTDEKPDKQIVPRGTIYLPK